MNNRFGTPILFIIFNRLDTTRRVLGEIRKIKPGKLFIAADGPRINKIGEKEKCDQVRKFVLNQIDWDCEVKTLFRDENLGCGKAVSSAITWFFQNEEDGIILEDDSLPNQSFFNFCEELLSYYKDNKSVMHISGDQFVSNLKNNSSYYFGKIMHCWGWASWADRWKYYDFSLKYYNDKNIEKFSKNKNVQNYWLNILNKMKNNKINTWDYQWVFKIVEKDGLCINPSKNLISNIGFGENSTHTFDKNNPLANLPTYEIKNIIHPKKIEIDQKAVDYIYQDHFGIDFDLSRKSILEKNYNFLRKNIGNTKKQYGK